MDLATRDEQLAKILAQLCQSWETHRKAASESRSPSRPFTIALSRQAGTQAATVARELGSRLGWQTYDQELLELIAQDMGLRASLLQSVDEKREPYLLEGLECFMDLPQVSNSAYAQHLVKTVLALGAHGECIIVGRGASIILPAATTLRVLLVAPREDRIATMSRKRGITLQEAERRVDTIDRERSQFVQETLAKNLDLMDTMLYDLVLNVSRFSIGACARVIIEALSQQQAHALEVRRPCPGTSPAAAV
jgi:cytidylate kinase